MYSDPDTPDTPKMSQAKVFLDTAAVKHSIRSRTVLRPKRQTMTWGNQVHEVVVHDIVEIDPTADVTVEPLRTEIDLLSEIAKRATADDIELLWNIESEIEFFGIYPLGGGASELIDAGVTMVEGPVKYDRLLTPMSPFLGETWRSIRTDFLRGLDHPRYHQLQRACGAHQGDRINENQLVDAFHVWCAEVAGASHFLTTDLKLVRLRRDHKSAPPKVRGVTPSQLLSELAANAQNSA